MFRIINHIERLLLMHDCVIIPRFGGFVLQTVSGAYRKEEHAFYPMRKEVVFNPSLQHTDGLLSESYMQVYEVDYKKAQQMLEEDVEELRSDLQRYKKVSLGNIGSFATGAEGQIVFHPGKSDSFDMDNYGLSMFHFPVLPVSTRESEEVALLTGKKKSRADIFYLPVNRKFLRVVGASAAAVALFLLVSTPVKDINTSAYTASFIPSEFVSKTTTEVFTSTTEAPTTTVEVKIETQPVTVAPSPNVAAPVASVSKKMYHVIIASFPSEKQANDYLSQVNRMVYKNVGMVVRDDKYRIYADKFDNREEAEASIETLRQTEKHKDAWLFIGR